MRKTLLVALSVLGIGCTNQSQVEIPDHVKDRDPLKIISIDQQPISTLKFGPELEFNTKDSVIIGIPWVVSVDDAKNVYITDITAPRITVFDSIGTYITQIGREGSGPGEFRSITDIHFNHDSLTVYDGVTKRFTRFASSLVHSMNDRMYTESFFRSIHLSDPPNPTNDEAVIPFPNPFFSTNDGQIISLFKGMSELSKVSMYLINNQGVRSVGPILEKTIPVHIVRTEMGSGMLPTSRNLLYAITADDQLVVANSETFLIDKIDLSGKILNSMYFALTPQRVQRDALLKQYEGKSLYRLIEIAELVDTWPVLHSMIVDDLNRIWVSAIIDSTTHHRWFVFDELFEMQYQFHLEKSKSIVLVKNGVAYIRTTDATTGLFSFSKTEISDKD